jgi:hypothetical protein
MVASKKNRATKKPLTPAQIAHEKFLKKMGVTKKQLKERKLKLDKLLTGDTSNDFRPDSLQTIRRAYDED